MNTGRLWSHVTADGDCWIWRGAVNSRGYGTICIAGRTRLVHRVSFESLVGPIPNGLTIDHVHERGCTSKRCVRPDHLEPVTRAENNRRYLVTRRPHKTVPDPSAPTPLVRRERFEAMLADYRDGRPLARTEVELWRAA